MNHRAISVAAILLISVYVENSAIAQTCGTTCTATSANNIYTDSSQPNFTASTSSYVTISGGGDNSVGVFSRSCTGSTIAGGRMNYIEGQESGSSDSYSTVSGGYENNIGAEQSGVTTPASSYDVIAGGGVNTMEGVTNSCVISGGGDNIVSGTATNNATIAGGGSNTASSSYTMIPGGYGNTASGEFAFAAGYGASASHEGSFVWSDSNGSCADPGNNAFTVCSSGTSSTYAAVFYTNTAHTSGAYLATNGTEWQAFGTSDRNRKDHIAAINGDELLEAMMLAPAVRWQYRESDVPHMGPMAQDFVGAFGLGNDDKTIAGQDIQGATFAAAQALYVRSKKSEEQVHVLQAKNSELESKVAGLEQKVAALSAIEARLAALEAKQNLHLRPARPANQATGLSCPA